MHGGAALQNFQLTTPAFKGLNTQAKNSLMDPTWATRLQNAVIDGSGRLAARKGWVSQTNTTAATEDFVQLIEYRQQNGDTELFATSATKAWRSTDGGDSWTDVTGTASFTDGNWQLQNFNDYVIGFQEGEAPLIYNGTTCSQAADVNAPTGSAGLAAFGRVWALDFDDVVIQYSALLDHTDWTSSDSGSFDLSSLLPGNDRVVALAEHNGALVVFCENNILFFVDGSGSALGIDPTQMYVVDTINGLGCAARDSVQAVGGDMWFLGQDYNIHSLGRVMQEKSNPVVNLSKNISDDLRDSITLTGHDISRLRSLYAPEERFYLLFLPRESAVGAGDEVGQTWVFDTRGTLEDGTARILGTWDTNVASACCVRLSGDLLWSLWDVIGEVGKYTGQQDNGNSYDFIYESGWIDLTQQSYLLMLKRITGLFFINTATTAKIKWAWDFATTFTTKDLTFAAGAVGAEFGIGEWNIGEFSGGVTLRENKTAGKGNGEFIKIGTEATINGGTYALQQLDLYARIGRLK